MSQNIITKCDVCGKIMETPSSWNTENSPFRNWFRWRIGDMQFNTDCCPDCVFNGKAVDTLLSQIARLER